MIKEGHGNQPINSFEEYVQQIDVKKRLPTSLENFICDENGNDLVDNILKFEELINTLTSYLSTLGIDIDVNQIPKLQASKHRKDYTTYYTDTLKRKVYELYSYDIKRFSYKF